MAPSTLDELLTAAAADAADVPAMRYLDRTLTYRELDAAVRAGAAAWQSLGLRPGDRVGVWSPNTLDCAIALLAVVRAGGLIVGINARYTDSEAADLVRRAGCRFVAASRASHGRDLAAAAATFAGEGGATALSTVVGLEDDWPRLVAEAGPMTPVPPSELAAIQYTSGTTGRPKGAMLRQAPIIGTSATWARIVGLGRGDVYPVLYPLAHVGGFKTGLIATTHARATIVLLPVVSATSIVEVVAGGGVTVLNAPPTAQAYVLAARRAGQLPGDLGIRTVVCGAATVPPDLIRGMLDEVGVTTFINGYGLTEATGVCAMTRPGDPMDVVTGTIGRPIDGVEARVRPATDETSQPGGPVIGELEVRGYNVMAGYLDDPEATAEAIVDGWLRTGDLGWIDDAGNIHIAGRSKDLVIVGGFNVYPAEIEHTLVEHPAVVEAAVIGVPDERLGEVTAAFVVANATVSPDELVSWCRQRLANFKVPRQVRLVDDLPRTAAGKISKRDLASLV